LIDSILVYVGGDLIGDGIMKLPFVRALKSAFPAARITWCAGRHKSVYARELAPLVRGLIDEVVEEAGIDRPMTQFFRRPLGGRRFDLVVDTQRGVAVTFILRRVRHLRFVSGAANFLLSDVRPGRGYQRPKSMVRQLLDLVSLASGRPNKPGAPLPLSAETRRAAEAALPSGPVYVGLAPGAGGQSKRWPLEQFIALAATQVERGRVPVFVLGPGEVELAGRLWTEAPQAIIPASDPSSGRPGSSDPAFTIAIAGRLAAAVANDAGVGHLLAAGDVPLVSLFGPTHPEKFAPSARKLEIVRAQDFGGDGMEAIPAYAVAAAAERLLQG
jgi:ADP-heptose:LPS heptosyltransferase